MRGVLSVKLLGVAILWGITAFAVVLLGDLGAPIATNYLLAVTVLIYGVWAFLHHGGPRITTVGLFNFACAFFVGYAGVVEASAPRPVVPPEFLTQAIMAAGVVQIAITTLAWQRAAPDLSSPTPVADRDAANIIVVWGFATVALMFIAQWLGIELALGYLGEGVAYAGVMLVTMSVLFRRRARVFSPHMLIAVAGFALYAGYFHQGTGRLRIVALACTLAVLITARFPRIWLKRTTVVVAPLAVWWLARDRLAFQESLEQGASAGRTGLESTLSPLTTFAEVFQAQAEGWPLRWGATFVTLPFVIFPDSMVPDWLPEALGYDLVHMTVPHRAGTGFSEASTAYGEWVWNFGVFGLLLMVPVTAWALVLLDRALDRAVRCVPVGGSRSLLRVAVLAMMSGTIADLAWSGLHTYGTRVLTRLPLFLLLYAFTSPTSPPALLPPITRRRNGARPP